MFMQNIVYFDVPSVINNTVFKVLLDTLKIMY